MNFGCIPIVTNVGGLPELVGENGRIVKRNLNIMASVVESIMLNNKIPVKSEHVKRDFTFEIRKSKLLNNLDRI